MRVLEKLTMKERKSLVWATLYDRRFTRAGKITSSYFKVLEILMNLIFIEEGGEFKDSEDCKLEMKCYAWNKRYWSTSSYDSSDENFDWRDNYLGWNIFKNIFDPDTNLTDWLASIEAIALHMGQDSCWTPYNFTINGKVVWQLEEDEE